MKRISVILFVLLSSLCTKAQQDAMYSQYKFNTLAINPAYAGSRDLVCATALLRSQWVGVEGAPKTQTISLDMPLMNKKLGLGVQVFNDKVGVTNLRGGFISGSYRIFLENSTLAFGLQGGASQLKADLNSVDLGNPNTDQAFLQNNNEIFINFGTGIYFNTSNFYLGISVPQLLKNKLNNNNITAGTNGAVNRQYVHLFAASGYVIELDQDFKIVPSVLFKAIQGAPVQVDLNAIFWIKDIFSVGAQYRSSTSVAAIMEVQVSNQIRVGYSYDRTITRLANFKSGSHEIMLRYEFGSQYNRVLSPRYF
ncbi:MAG: PorP/SprF family type IX secretion system membrane protein [Daejeonella sp.]